MSEIDVPVSQRLSGRVALVVGGGQTPGATIGNGRATAVLLARAGAEVVVADRELESATETAEMIAAEGNQATACHLDVTDDDEHERVIGQILADNGRLDILHNNVGTSIRGGDADPLEIRLAAAAATDAIRVALETWAESDADVEGPGSPAEPAVRCLRELTGGMRLLTEPQKG
jgi:NAD(P)-dependent dehydrogenase (short-subunit alcohol dehydrogenase family)